MTKAERLAFKIDIAAQGAMDGTLTIESASAITRGLWDNAEELGVAYEVSCLLQALSNKEFESALRSSNTPGLEDLADELFGRAP